MISAAIGLKLSIQQPFNRVPERSCCLTVYPWKIYLMEKISEQLTMTMPDP